MNMAGAKEIRSKIASVQNTQKITKAMEMVAASKMRKSQDRMNWFILFGILGVNTYGNREIAKVRNNKEDLNRTFFEIFYMQMIDMAVAMAAYYVFIRFTVHENQLIYQLTGLTMIATMLDISWFS